MRANLALIFCSLALCLFASPLAALDPAKLVRAWAALGWKDIRVMETGGSGGTNFAAKVRRNTITGNSTKKMLIQSPDREGGQSKRSFHPIRVWKYNWEDQFFGTGPNRHIGQ